MECRNRQICVDDILGRLPGLVDGVVTDPIDLVEQFAPQNLGAEDLVNPELGKPVHLDGQGRRHDTARECVRHMRLQQADMEHRMDFHGRRQTKAEGRISDWANDGEWPETSNIQLGRRTRGGDVTAEKPHSLPRDKIWSCPATPIRGELHRFSSF